MALWISNGVAQIIFIIVLFSESTYQNYVFHCININFITIFIISVIQFKLVITNELKDAKLKMGVSFNCFYLLCMASLQLV